MMRFPKADKLLEAVAKRSPREKKVLLGALAALSLVFIDRVIVASLSAKTKGLDQAIAERESEIRKDLRIMAQKQRIEVQHINYKPYLGMMSTENEEFTVFLKEVDTLTKDNGIYVVDMKPTGTKEMGKAKKYLINLNIEAEMAPLVKFMFAIEDSKKLMTVEKYQVSPKSKDSQSAKCSLLISKLVIP
jgi:hypothetical protein